MKITLAESRTLKTLSLGIGLAAAFQALSGLIFKERKAETHKHYSMPNKVSPKAEQRYAEILGMN